MIVITQDEGLGPSEQPISRECKDLIAYSGFHN